MKIRSSKAITVDMTKGPPLRLIMTFAIPMLIGNIFQQIYNLADTMIAGRFLGSQAIAAIGSVSIIYSLILNITWGFNNGYCILLARAFGKGEKSQFKKAVAAMIELNIMLVAILTLLFSVLLKPIMHLLHTPADIFAEAYVYIAVVVGGMLATIAYNALAGYLRSMGNSRTPLYFLILSSLLNLSLDVLFVVALKMGVAGTAWATVIAQAVSALLCGVYIRRNYSEYLPASSDFVPDGVIIRDMFSTGFSMALMQSVFSLGTVVLQRAINDLGTSVVTAHTAARRIIEMLMIPMSSVASADSTFVGQNYGAKKYKRIREANRKMLSAVFLWSAFSVAVSWIFGRSLAVWLVSTQEEGIISNALLNLRISIVCFFPLGALFVLRYSMQAMGHKILPVLSSMIELIVKIVSAAVLVPRLGYRGVTVTEPAIWCMCAIFLGIFYVAVGHQKREDEIN